MKTVKKVTVNFKMTPEEREKIKILAAKARLSQSEFLRRLISTYGEELVIDEKQLQGQVKWEPIFTGKSESHFPDYEIPTVHIFSNKGELTTVAYDGNGVQLPLATLDEMMKTGYVLASQSATEGWNLRIQEGVIHYFIEDDGSLTWIDVDHNGDYQQLEIPIEEQE